MPCIRWSDLVDGSDFEPVSAFVFDSAVDQNRLKIRNQSHYICVLRSGICLFGLRAAALAGSINYLETL